MKKTIYYLSGAGTSLITTFALPDGGAGGSMAEIFFSFSSIIFLGFFIAYNVIEIVKKDIILKYKLRNYARQ